MAIRGVHEGVEVVTAIACRLDDDYARISDVPNGVEHRRFHFDRQLVQPIEAGLRFEQ
jgi:hypothetical protein